MLVSYSLMKLVLISAQILYRVVLLPTTNAMDRATWEACLYPGGYH